MAQRLRPRPETFLVDSTASAGLHKAHRGVVTELRAAGGGMSNIRDVCCKWVDEAQPDHVHEDGLLAGREYVSHQMLGSKASSSSESVYLAAAKGFDTCR